MTQIVILFLFLSPMKAHELRIGNAYRRHVEPVMVASIAKFPMSSHYDVGVILLDEPKKEMTFKSTELQPIVISEHWLEMFGFVPHVGDVVYKRDDLHLCRLEPWAPFTAEIKGLSLDIRYVHELQDLFLITVGELLSPNVGTQGQPVYLQPA